MLTVVRPFYQASFQLGHPVDVDNAESIEWPDGVEAKQEVHKTKGAEGTQLSVKFPEPHMATVNIFPCGKVEVSTASSEKAARQSMATVSSAFREAGCAPRDNVTTPENTFRITNITAKFEKPGSTLIIHQEQTKEILESKFMSVVYEPELKQRLTLKVKTTGYAEVTFRFNVKTIDVWGKELEEMERLFHENVYDCVKWKETPTPAGVQGANGGGKTAAVKQPCTRTALDLAVKKIVGSLPAGPRPNGGYLSRHAQIQKWLQETHKDKCPALPDYDPMWGPPGRHALKHRSNRVWAGMPYEAFWDNNMVPALDGSPVKEVGWSVPPASAATPAVAASTPATAAASSAPAASSAAEAGGAASSAMGAPAEDASADSEPDDFKRVRAMLEEHQASKSSTITLFAKIVTLMTNAQEEGRERGLWEAELGGSLPEQQATEQRPVQMSLGHSYRGLSALSDEAQEECTRFCSLSSEGDESGGARCATAYRVLHWPCTNRHRSCAGGEAPPGKKQKRGEAIEAPRDVAARLLQDLGTCACPLPETADLHDECVRICMLIMRSGTR